MCDAVMVNISDEQESAQPQSRCVQGGFPEHRTTNESKRIKTLQVPAVVVLSSLVSWGLGEVRNCGFGLWLEMRGELLAEKVNHEY